MTTARERKAGAKVEGVCLVCLAASHGSEFFFWQKCE